MDQPQGIHRLVTALADAGSRRAAAARLAEAMGCSAMALFVRDPALGVLLPASHMPKTFAGGPLWRSFMQLCAVDGRHDAQIDLPPGTLQSASAITLGGCVAVMLGGRPADHDLEVLQAEMPVLGALLRAEQALSLGAAESGEARDAASRAHTLVRALDTSRATAAGLNEQLRREHERKDEFLAMLAHELRNPLSPLVNSVEILRRLAGLEGAVAQRQLNIMGRQLGQLTRLVDDLLDVSRVSRGKIELRRETMLLAEVIEAALETTRPAIEARGHRLQVQGAEAPLYINGDRVRLTQVFSNLLVNAVKYTDPGGALSVSIVPDGGRVSVVVRDSGMGIPPEMLPHIFELFTQVPVSLDRSQGGLGIGLTLVRTLVELHGGHVTAHSVGLGHGSTFTASLPLVAAPSGSALPLLPGTLEAAQNAGPSIRVLVVDDNVDAADSMAEVLRFMGVHTEVAHNGFDALALAATFAPELVLLDIGLPGMDGYEAARRMRALPGPRMRLVALTGYGREEDRERSRDAGFDTHLVKPVSPQVIETLIDSLVRPQAATWSAQVRPMQGAS